MGKWFEAIAESHGEWLRQQHLFFVASAASTGHVNVSPKGHARETFALISEKQIAYLDMTGSGNETFVHSKVDGRITVLFVALEGPPRIMRLHGRCRCILKENVSPELRAKFSERFVNHKGFRAVVVVDVERVSSSCGYSIPCFDYVKERPTLFETFEKKSEEEMEEYHILKNSFSIDGLPGIGHRQHDSSKPRVTMRLTDGTGKATPGARDGYWYGYRQEGSLLADLRDLFSCQQARTLRSALARDLTMVGLGALATYLVMARRTVKH